MMTAVPLFVMLRFNEGFNMAMSLLSRLDVLAMASAAEVGCPECFKDRARSRTFPAQLRARDPEQRIEPVNCAGKFRDDLNQPVVSLHMRELMTEYHAHAFVRPGFGFPWQQNARTKRSPCPKNGSIGIPQQAHATAQCESVRHFANQFSP